MNFLDLVRDLARETGTLAGGVNLSSVITVNGRAEKLTNWVQKAWRNIQNDQRDWLWMRAEFEGVLLPATSRYTAGSFNITRLGEWRGDGLRPAMWLHDGLIGLNDAAELEQIDYDDWRYRYDRRAVDAGRPRHWAVSPQDELVFGPVPDREYVVRGEYQKSPQVLVANTDVPEMPAKFHDLITWEAMRLLDRADGAYDAMASDAQEAITLRHQLKREQLEPIRDASGSIG